MAPYRSTSSARWSGARRRLYVRLAPEAWPGPGLSPLNRLVGAVIFLAVGVAVASSEPVLYDGRERWFLTAEIVFTAVFAVEYLARAWVCVEAPGRSGWRGRLRYLLSPAALLDLAALMPLLVAFAGSEAFLLRLFRVLRIMRLARLGRFSRAMRVMIEAVQARAYELSMSVAIAVGLLLMSSAVLYAVEGQTQPEAFGSIPRAMWWSVATLTTVGYGDVTPVTGLGKLFAGFTAIIGIGIIAMPTGILAAAFSDALERQRRAERGADA